METKAEVLSRIKALSQSVIESEENANNLVDLLGYLQSEDTPVLKASVRAVCKLYVKLVKEHYGWLVPAGAKRQPQCHGATDKVTQQYHDWMRKNYTVCLERLLQLVHHDNHNVQELALCSLMKMIQTEGSAHQATYHGYVFPNVLFHQVVTCLLDNARDMKHLIGRFEEYLEFDDVRFYWLKNIASIVLAKVDQKARPVTVSDCFVENISCALELVQMPASEENVSKFFAGVPPLPQREEEEEGEEGEEEKEERRLHPPKAKRSKSEEKALNVSSLHKHRKQFSDAWLAYLRLPLSPTLYRRVLVSLHSSVMPHLLDPRLLIDFLIDSYDAGGVISLLALNGLFILMHEYHLPSHVHLLSELFRTAKRPTCEGLETRDYPEFYTKLYALLEPSVFHVKYMQRFFYLMDTFLRSTHLPLYLVAAFAKKIARFALTAPPNGVMVAVVFVSNLVKRHPNCRVLLHRANADGVELSSDPFDVGEPDPAKSGALESCLWELKTLQAHYAPAVSGLVKRLLSPDASNMEEELSKYLDITYEQLFEEDCASDKEQAALNFHEPSDLWKLPNTELYNRIA